MKKIQSKMKALECSQHYVNTQVDFSDAQGQVTMLLVSGRIWLKFKSSKLLCMSSSPARIKMIQSKVKGLEWSQHFSHYKYGDFSGR